MPPLSEVLAAEVNGVEALPAEELDLALDGLSVADQFDLLAEGVAAEVAVGGGGLIDGVLETEALNDGRRAQIEILSDA